MVILEKHQIGGKSRPLIMVIEDDEIFRDYLIMLFQNQEWDILLAENGDVALEYLHKKQPIDFQINNFVVETRHALSLRINL